MASAAKLFAQNGYAATSTKDICDDAKVNIAAIHYHYKSKENLYRHIITHFATQGFDRVSQILRPPKTMEEFRVRLEMFLESGTETMIEHPAVTQIILRDVAIMNRLCRDIFMSTFGRIDSEVVSFLKAAKKKGVLRHDMDPFMAAQFLTNQLTSQNHYAREIRKLFRSGDLSDPVYRRKWVRETVSLFLIGVMDRHQEPNSQ